MTKYLCKDCNKYYKEEDLMNKITPRCKNCHITLVLAQISMTCILM